MAFHLPSDLRCLREGLFLYKVYTRDKKTLFHKIILTSPCLFR